MNRRRPVPLVNAEGGEYQKPRVVRTTNEERPDIDLTWQMSATGGVTALENAIDEA